MANNLKLAPYVEKPGPWDPATQANPSLGVELLDSIWANQPYPEFTNLGAPITWEENLPFRATLTFLRSTPKGGTIVLDQLTKRWYTLFPSEIFQILQTGAVAGGEVTGLWEVVKRNKAYGLGIIELDAQSSGTSAQQTD